MLLSMFNSHAQKAETNKSPNILYIFTDDQSIRTLSSYEQSHNWVQTPNIDKLSKKGVQFNYCYTGAKCVPSRGNALTGQFQYNYTKDTAYWPAEFRKQGYYTGMIGKWHWSRPRHDETWDWSAVWEHYLPENHKNYYVGQQLRINGDSLVDLNGYSTDRYTDYTIDFLKERAKFNNQPWYFWLCYAGVHGPYTPAERHSNMYLDQPEIPTPIDVFGPRPNKPDYLINMSMWDKDENGKPLKNKRSLDSWVKQYNQAVKSIDEGVGRIMEVLEETGQIDNTIIIFTSDNGYAWGQHGFRLKIAPYDANLLTPLIVYQPNKFAQGKKCNYPVNGVDIIKTIHAIGNVTPSNSLDGRNLTDLLKNPTSQNWDETPMIQAYTGNVYGNEAMSKELKKASTTGNWEKFVVHQSGIRAWIMMRKGNFKYVRYIYENYIEELYDLTKDPKELNNLAVNNTFHNLLEEYRKETISQFEANGATFTNLLPEPKIISN
ncbi:MAG: arylsulfatase A-like enzyme [Cyclobacteriaceae bacterium]|jgi:arylsulfatase A-like enzyme